jgi:hypothetical protein
MQLLWINLPLPRERVNGKAGMTLAGLLIEIPMFFRDKNFYDLLILPTLTFTIVAFFDI